MCKIFWGWDGTKYLEIDAHTWKTYFTKEYGYRVIARNDGGFTVQGPRGDIIIWDDDAKKAYKILSE